MPAEIRTFRLKVCGTIEFSDGDTTDAHGNTPTTVSALEQLFLVGSGEKFERAIQSLEEDCTELSVEMTRI